MYLAHNSGYPTFLAVDSEMLNGSCQGFSNFCDHLAVQRSLAERLLREVVQHWSNGVIRNLLLVCVIEFGYSKRVFVLDSYLVPFCLRTEMKNLDKQKVELIGRFVFNCSRLFQRLTKFFPCV